MTVKHFTCFFTLTILVSVVLTRPSDINVNEDEPIFVDQNTLTKSTIKFRCKPQERSFLSKSFLNDGDLHSDETIRPNNIILHRCDENSGCCQTNDETCGPTKTRKVTFELVAYIPGTKTERFIRINESHHTNCRCAGKSLPKRDDCSAAIVQSDVTSTGLTLHTIQHSILSLVIIIIHLFIVNVPM